MIEKKENVLISVVMTIFRGTAYLEEAIESILNQTYSTFEFIIVCEYETSKECLEIVDKYAAKDERIVLIKNEEKLGISASLNRGLKCAKGEYIARMDDDDISSPRRLEIQKMYMDSYPEIGICGIRHKVLNAPNWLVDYSADPQQLQTDLLFFSPLRHPTIMMRKTVIEKFQLYYDEELPGAEDYELYIRAAQCTRITNILEDNLFYHRRTNQNLSLIHRDRDNALQITFMRNHYLTNLKLAFSDREFKCLLVVTMFRDLAENQYMEEIQQLRKLLDQILNANRESGKYSDMHLIKSSYHRWQRVRYSLKMIYHGNIPQYLLDEWRKGKYYCKWMN
ncbi:glycosyltransferase family 2 protein [Lachnospiraceae bacterium OttesenSCG-928-D06]|nr:glycosyltransferase family 2 protein [Lachnospiraceae bacterium OttesenSCG-928-D06]